MPIAPVRLVGISARNEEAVMVSVGGTTFIMLVKAPVTPGFPQREVELFTLADAINVNVGPLHFNLDPLRLDVQTQDFYLLSAMDRGMNVVRFYWSPVAPSIPQTLKYMDIDWVNRTAAPSDSGSLSGGFEAIDPFIMDARTVPAPNRLYLLYVRADGSNAYRVSTDFGATWGTENIFDPTGGQPPIRQSEGVFFDPSGTLDEVEVLQWRDTPPTPGEMDAWLSRFPQAIPPVNIAFLGEDTIRGGKLLVVPTSSLFVDTTRDQAFRGLTVPTGWTSVNVGAGAVVPTRDGLIVDTGVVAGGVAGLQTPDDYDRFDVAVDASSQYPALEDINTTAPIDLAVLEARSLSGDSVRVRLRRGVGSDPSARVVFGDFTIGGVTTTGGITLAPKGATVTLRIVRNRRRIFAFAAIRSQDADGYESLVKVVDYDRFAVDAGRIRIYAANLALNKRVRTAFTNYTVRSHGFVGRHLFDDKLDVASRRLVGNVPAATVEEVGFVDVTLFGLFGEAVYTNGFRYVLPSERTLGRETSRTLFTVQDPVLRDES